MVVVVIGFSDYKPEADCGAGTDGEEDTVRGSQTIGTLKVLGELSGLDGVRNEDWLLK